MTKRVELKKNLQNVPIRDRCQTPPYALDPIIPYLNKEWTIWEPAVGEGYLANGLMESGFEVVGTDIVFSTEEDDQDFLTCDIPDVDAIVTNPPYSIKYKWIARCYEIGLPFALLIPTDTIGNKSAQKYFRKYGVELMVLNKRVNFKMPEKGWEGAGAFFSTSWYCWNILPEQIMYGKLIQRHPTQASFLGENE